MKSITILLLLFCSISLNASEQTSIKRIEVVSKKITVSKEQINERIQTNKMDSPPMLQTMITVTSDGKLHTQCDVKHNHDNDGELR